ncbi:hypothetical protein SUGI_1481850 [Cryptomeria japonica]|uniref:Uncharacterized protein n=1 Tax=Cryptomeria japonica TaxID=3369 RepID=A0AAD3RRQ0_CRYJA|nr:hypothetical protein SUGI_1481850 [Cryptomeria japonica]
MDGSSPYPAVLTARNPRTMGWSYFTIFRPAKDLIGWSLYKPGTLQLQSGSARARTARSLLRSDTRPRFSPRKGKLYGWVWVFIGYERCRDSDPLHSGLRFPKEALLF